MIPFICLSIPIVMILFFGMALASAINSDIQMMSPGSRVREFSKVMIVLVALGTIISILCLLYVMILMKASVAA